MSAAWVSVSLCALVRSRFSSSGLGLEWTVSARRLVFCDSAIRVCATSVVHNLSRGRFVVGLAARRIWRTFLAVSPLWEET